MVKIIKKPEGKFFIVPGFHPRTEIFVAENRNSDKIIESFRIRYGIRLKAGFQKTVRKVEQVSKDSTK